MVTKWPTALFYLLALEHNRVDEFFVIIGNNSSLLFRINSAVEAVSPTIILGGGGRDLFLVLHLFRGFLTNLFLCGTGRIGRIGRIGCCCYFWFLDQMALKTFMIL